MGAAAPYGVTSCCSDPGGREWRRTRTVAEGGRRGLGALPGCPEGQGCQPFMPSLPCGETLGQPCSGEGVTNSTGSPVLAGLGCRREGPGERHHARLQPPLSFRDARQASSGGRLWLGRGVGQGGSGRGGSSGYGAPRTLSLLLKPPAPFFSLGLQQQPSWQRSKQVCSVWDPNPSQGPPWRLNSADREIHREASRHTGGALQSPQETTSSAPLVPSLALWQTRSAFRKPLGGSAQPP